MLAVTACTDEDYDVTIDTPAVPFDAEMEAALSHYDVLGKYADEVGVPMGVSVNPETLNAQTLLFSIVKTNFTQVEAPGLFLPVNLFSEGTYDFAGLNTLKTAAGEAGVSVFGPAICSLANQPQEYLDGLIAPIIIPYVPTLPESGEFVINDFESCKIGDTFPMTNGSTATVEYDPDAVSGNVLHIGSAETPAAQSFATFTVTMPDGRTLGDLKLISFDMKAEGSTGLYGQGLRLIINGTTLSFGCAASFDCGSGTWVRGLIKLEIDQANFSAADQALNTFTVSLGSATGSGNYYIDNIAAKWEVPGDDPGTDVAVSKKMPSARIILLPTAVSVSLPKTPTARAATCCRSVPTTLPSTSPSRRFMLTFPTVTSSATMCRCRSTASYIRVSGARVCASSSTTARLPTPSVRLPMVARSASGPAASSTFRSWKVRSITWL